MLSKILRATLLDSSVYPELKEDPSAFLYSLATVVLAAVAFGTGSWLVAVRELENPNSSQIPVAVLTVLVGWVIWTLVNYLVGVRLLGGQSSYREVLRALGVTHGPGMVMFLAAVPQLGLSVFVFAYLWTLAAGVVAMRATLGVGWVQVILPALFGWLPGFMLAMSIVPTTGA